ncbi:hypothetical protein Q7P37_004878 [Cladosporium fusiforme]
MAVTQSLPGFTPLNDRIFIRRANPESQTSTGPDTIVIFAWGDSSPKHVAKYTEGFHVLFPDASQVVVFSAIASVLLTTSKRRTRDLQPLIELLSMKASNHAQGGPPPRTLIHCMSNTGGICYASLLDGFKKTLGQPLPHDLLVLDSTPGTPDLTWFNLQRWSKAMALGTAKWFPWPFAITQTIWGAFLCVLYGVEWLIGRQSAASVSTGMTNDAAFETQSARRLYLYGKEDDLIFWKDIGQHAATARNNGYPVDCTMFEGSGHVSHMRLAPARYWSAIRESWIRSQQ